MNQVLRTALAVILGFATASCSNNPWRPGEAATNTYFTSFGTPTSKLDPTTAYYTHELRLLGQIYEPPLQYHYLKRPYQVIPLTAREVPTPVYFDAEGRRLTAADPPVEEVARAEYTIRIRPDITYQNHPCFARNASGSPVYDDVDPAAIRDYQYPSEFPEQGTRTVTADDYLLQIRRLADPRLSCPVFSAMARYILGLDELHEAYKRALEAERGRRREAGGPAYNREQDELENPIRLDYMAPDFPGAVKLDDLTYKIVLKRKYPQIQFWLCMVFFGPMPREALDLYDQPAMREKQFSINRCPVGSGAYYLHTYRPNEVVILERNPNFHAETYPESGAPGDRQAGLLEDAGKRVPFIDRQVLRLEEEALSGWNKFLQGYYDDSGISSDVFDRVIQMDVGSEPDLSAGMKDRGISLITAVNALLYETRFNMLDDVVGGYEPEKCRLRRAIAMALDYGEYLDIFSNGRGVVAQGPLPPGFFGYRGGKEGVNPHTCVWDPTRGKPASQPIEAARKLLTEAGYPDGRGPDGKPLTLHFDHAHGGNTQFRSRLQWMQQRLDRIGIRMVERATDLSRFREKILQGNWQLSSGGWGADYPDPENFLFLYYGPNAKATSQGANSSNYSNPEFDRLFVQMESMQNSPARQELIDRMVEILRHDAPVAWQYFPVSYSLQHQWYRNVKPHQVTYNVMKYRRIDPAQRADRQRAWNEPVYWPLAVAVLLLIAAVAPAVIGSYKRERGLD